MTDLQNQKKELDWYDEEKVNNMSFDSPEWFETRKILDDPSIPEEVKQNVWKNYKALLFKRMGVKGY